MKMIRPLIAATLLGTALSASAAGTGWYLAADVGRAEISDTKDQIDGALTDVGVTGLTSSFDEKDSSYGLILGYSFNQNFAIEGGYVDLGKYEYSAAFTGPVAGTASASAEADGWKISAVGIMPVSDTFSVNGKLHAVYSDVKLNASATGSGGAASGGVSDHSWDFGYGIGLEYKLSSQWSLRGNWDRYANVGDDSSTGESDVDVWTVGFKYSF